jgi:hypothetical protein
MRVNDKFYCFTNVSSLRLDLVIICKWEILILAHLHQNTYKIIFILVHLHQSTYKIIFILAHLCQPNLKYFSCDSRYRRVA